MTPFEQHFADLSLLVQKHSYEAACTALPSGAHLVEIRGYRLSADWSQREVTITFVAPPGYPSAQPDCFWVSPTGIRLRDGRTPQNTNDANPVPEAGPKGTWFSWHVQSWNPNRDSLITYFNIIKGRLEPAR